MRTLNNWFKQIVAALLITAVVFAALVAPIFAVATIIVAARGIWSFIVLIIKFIF